MLRQVLVLGQRAAARRGCGSLRRHSRWLSAAAEKHQHQHRHHGHADCWNCHHATDCCALFCPSCDAIQPLQHGEKSDFFQVFHLPKHFNVEQRKMEKTYWNLQKRLHPDLYGSKSEFEKELSAVNAALVNDAYNMLKTPSTRVKYLLALHGIDALSETASTAVDPEILMETMQMRERIEDATSLDELDSVRGDIAARIDQVISKLGEVYDKQHDLEATKHYAVELQYMVKCAEAVDAREDQLDK